MLGIRLLRGNKKCIYNFGRQKIWEVNLKLVTERSDYEDTKSMEFVQNHV
jgi:hypothetical protein